MSRWDDLLAVQDHDVQIDQLEHRKVNLPARAELEAVMARIADADAALTAVEEQRHPLVREQARIEDEVALTTEKMEKHDKALYAGTVTNPRDLQAMQDEIASLKRRIGQLEDQELEVMEQVEPLDTETARLTESRAALDADGEVLRGRIAEDEVAIDAELESARAARSAEAAVVDDALLAEYETLRKPRGGIGVARLVGGSCGGCHLGLPAVEVDRLKKLDPDEPAYCEECGRLLVR
jgi:predicted  nucleic acid-binding Zn-ribbon protein